MECNFVFRVPFGTQFVDCKTGLSRYSHCLDATSGDALGIYRDGFLGQERNLNLNRCAFFDSGFPAQHMAEDVFHQWNIPVTGSPRQSCVIL